VKHTFLQAALIYHPDRPNTGNTKIFISIRNAFEQIYFNSNNNDTNQSNTNKTRQQKKWTNDNEYNIWFQNEIKSNSQYLHFTINEQQQNELITVHTTLQQGGLDKGGYWEMARYISQQNNIVQEEFVNKQKQQNECNNNSSSSSSKQSDPIQLLSSSSPSSTTTSDTTIRRRRRPQR
jgi:hypothetical protein